MEDILDIEVCLRGLSNGNNPYDPLGYMDIIEGAPPPGKQGLLPFWWVSFNTSTDHAIQLTSATTTAGKMQGWPRLTVSKLARVPGRVE